MISKTNSTKNLKDDEFDYFAKELSDITSVDNILENLEKRRQNVLKGGTNCIPFPFERFRQEIPGIEQGQYVVVSANQKVGKSNWANYLYVFHALDYAFEHPEKCSVHIIYFPLEETIQKIIERYLSFLLFKIDGIRISPADLRSTSPDFPVDEEILDRLNTPKYQDRINFFQRCVQFETEETNPTGILRVCEKYAKSVGTFKSHKATSNGNDFKEIEIFDSYKQNDPNHYKIVIVDHISLNIRRAI